MDNMRLQKFIGGLCLVLSVAIILLGLVLKEPVDCSVIIFFLLPIGITYTTSKKDLIGGD